MVNNQSTIDPSRKTVGAMYRDAALKNSESFVVAGDLAHELMNSLVDDLNEAIASDPFEGRPFYITIYEKKDLQMPRAILRRLYKTLYRPYPEDDTIVYYINPKFNISKHLWTLPHWSEMDNVLMNFAQYPKDYINDIKAWRSFNLPHFGFEWSNRGVWAIPEEEKPDASKIRNLFDAKREKAKSLIVV